MDIYDEEQLHRLVEKQSERELDKIQQSVIKLDTLIERYSKEQHERI